MVSVKNAATSPAVANVSRLPRSRSPSRHAYSSSNSRVTDSGVRKAPAWASRPGLRRRRSART
uniref:Uncharacterized protein n=1 Tax=Human herpesvirus 1 TaxID=10298 RepID=A0A2Z4GZT8_HHV1|nr:hypothetical protein [Human alphaherpesvirus 1]AWW09477.1 hypothetical protein [Human alphaherpesvirus 1]